MKKNIKVMGLVVLLIMINAFCMDLYAYEKEDDYVWKECEETLDTNNLLAVANGNGITVAVGERGLILRSTDGVNWEKVDISMAESIDTSINIGNVWWEGQKFVLMTYDNTIYVSVDGTTWEKDDDNVFYDALKTNSRNFVSVDISDKVYDFAVNDSVVVGIGKENIFVSQDKQTWELVDIDLSMMEDLETIIWANNEFVIYGNSATDNKGIQLKSTDGYNWESYNVAVSMEREMVAYNGDIFLKLERPSLFSISNDGINWYTSWFVNEFPIIFDITWDGENFIAVGANGAIICPTDEALKYYENIKENDTRMFGIDWKFMKEPLEIENMIWNGSEYIVQSNQTDLIFGDDKKWYFENETNNIVDIWNGEEYLNYYTDKMLDYSSVEEWFSYYEEQNSYEFIKYSYRYEQKFVLADDILYISNDNSNTNTKGQIYSSEDGLNFNMVYEVTENQKIIDFTWNGNYFYLLCQEGEIGDYSSSVLVSEDGSKWEKIVLENSSAPKNITWNNELILINTRNGAYTSTDNTDWEYHGIKSTIKTVCWDGEKFIGIAPYHIGALGTLFISYDGKAWEDIYKGDLYHDVEEILWNGEYLVMYTESKVYYTKPDDIIKVIVNNEPVKFDVAPVIENDKTLVSMREIIEKLGGTISWDSITKEITCNIDDVSIALTLGQKEAYINGELKEMEVSPKLINDRTFIPLRFIAENFGLEVTWDSEIKEILITN